MLLSGKSLLPEGNPMTTYNYCGSKRWSGKERQQFRRAWRVHRKQFQLLRSAVSGKLFSIPIRGEFLVSSVPRL